MTSSTRWPTRPPGSCVSCDPDTAVLVGLSNLSVALVNLAAGSPFPTVGPSPGASERPTATPRTGSVAPGPPFPDPVPGRYVYDQADVFRADTIAKVQAQIQGIRDRTGAEIVVYSQVVGSSVTESEADAHAQALMDQWGVGRRGFDDGLVILYDLNTSRSSRPGPALCGHIATHVMEPVQDI